MSLSQSPPASPLPEAGHDAGDPNQPIEEDRDTPPPPMADPHADVDEFSSDESVLSEVDEAQFEDFDPSAAAALDDDRPAIAVDEDTVKLLGRHKRKRAEEGDDAPKRKREGRREKVKKNRRGREDSDDGFSLGEEMEGKRRRKAKPAGEVRERKKRTPTPENEEALTPEESESIYCLFKFKSEMLICWDQDASAHSIGPLTMR